MYHQYASISSVQLLSCVQLFATPWTAACQASLSITNTCSLLKFMSTKSVMPSNNLILCHHFSSCLQSFPALGSFFKRVSSSHQMAKVLEFHLQHQSFQWIFRTDFLKDGLLGSPCCPRDSKSLLQCYSSKASILWCSWVLMFVRGLSGNIKWDLNSNLRFERHFLDININTVSFRFYKSGMWMRLPGEWV